MEMSFIILEACWKTKDEKESY